MVVLMPDQRLQTVPPSASNEPIDASLEEQQRLTLALSQHADAHVRLIAHMSERQLDLSYRVGELARAVESLKDTVNRRATELGEKIDALSAEQQDLASRQDHIEDQLPLFNGNSAPT